jgi:hypothetical protein
VALMACEWVDEPTLSTFHEVTTRPLTDDYANRINNWLDGDEAHGGFHTPPFPKPNQATTIWFSDLATAMTFKLRFG